MTTISFPRRAVLHLDSWAGRTTQVVEVIAETAKRYRVRALLHTRLAGRCRSLAVGEVALVPKGAITFETKHQNPEPIAPIVGRVVAEIMDTTLAQQERAS